MGNSKKKNGVSKKKLNKSINNLRENINKSFDEVISRLDALEKSDGQNSIDIRNLQIKTRSMAGETYKNIAFSIGLSKSRVGQIVKDS